MHPAVRCWPAAVVLEIELESRWMDLPRFVVQSAVVLMVVLVGQNGQSMRCSPRCWVLAVRLVVVHWVLGQNGQLMRKSVRLKAKKLWRLVKRLGMQNSWERPRAPVNCIGNCHSRLRFEREAHLQCRLRLRLDALIEVKVKEYQAWLCWL